MLPQISRKKTIFLTLFFTVLISVAALLFLLLEESALRPIQHPQPLVFTGEYTVDGEKDAHPFTGASNLKLSRASHTLTFVGNLDREIKENEPITLHLNNAHLRMFVNDELFFDYGSPGSVLPHVKASGHICTYISSPGILPTDTVRMEITNLYKHSANQVFINFFDNLSTGNPLVHVAKELQANVFSDLASTFILFMGLLELGYALILLRNKESANEYLALAGLSIFSGIWFMVEFPVMGLFIPYPISNNAIQSLSLCMMLCSGILYAGVFYTGTGRQVMIANAVSFMVLQIISIIMQFQGIADFYDFTGLIYIFVGIAFLEMLFFFAKEYHEKRNAIERRKLFALLFLISAAMADVLCSFLGLMPYLIFQCALAAFNAWHLYMVWASINILAREKASASILRQDHERQQRLLEYQTLMTQSTKGLYESIYELDITHNCAGGESTEKYFESMGLAGNAPYDEALEHIANTQIHPDYRDGYLRIFSPGHVAHAFHNGIESLQYDFLFSKDGSGYYWLRMDARIFYWRDDDSIRMITYRQNIQVEKEKELILLSRAELDPLTGLLNREALEQKAKMLIQNRKKGEIPCCCILDVDNFKSINDTYGHMAGDAALVFFGEYLLGVFPADALIGRLGGDEFILFSCIEKQEYICQDAETFLQMLSVRPIPFEGESIPLSASIGIALDDNEDATFDMLYRSADIALYRSKQKGKECFTLYE